MLFVCRPFWSGMFLQWLKVVQLGAFYPPPSCLRSWLSWLPVKLPA